jgi:50S ribosomal subunit-associated GTPase HflX
MGLSEKPFIVIANKCDLSGFDENYKVFTQKFPELAVLPISCKSGDGLEALTTYLFEHFLPKTAEIEEETDSEEKETTLDTADVLK